MDQVEVAFLDQYGQLTYHPQVSFVSHGQCQGANPGPGGNLYKGRAKKAADRKLNCLAVNRPGQVQNMFFRPAEFTAANDMNYF
jgi:hypothetical protein